MRYDESKQGQCHSHAEVGHESAWQKIRVVSLTLCLSLDVDGRKIVVSLTST